jgi:hypothetical protein
MKNSLHLSAAVTNKSIASESSSIKNIVEKKDDDVRNSQNYQSTIINRLEFNPFTESIASNKKKLVTSRFMETTDKYAYHDMLKRFTSTSNFIYHSPDLIHNQIQK